MIRQEAIKQKTPKTRRNYYALAFCGLLCLAGAVTAFACGWSLFTDHSVRFNTLRTGRGFYRLPPLPVMYDGKTGKELTVAELGDYSDFEEDWAAQDSPVADSPETAGPTGIWHRARVAVQEGNLPKAQGLLKEFLITSEFMSGEEVPYLQKRRNAAVDILDALTALRSGSRASSVKEYLEARYAYDDGLATEAVDAFRTLKEDRNLQDNWDYLHAALLVTESRDLSLEAFTNFAAKYPRSEKNEAALYMVAKLTMEGSYSFENARCGVSGKDEWGKNIDMADVEPTEKCRDINWHDAVAAFGQVIKKHPKGRYFNDARGWLAYLYRRGGERSMALAEYYRLLGDKSDLRARLEAKNSLQMIGQEYDDAILDRVEQLIAGDSDAALAYAYHRIYNHAVDLSYQQIAPYYAGDYSESGNQEKKRVADANRDGKHELERIVRFSSTMMKRYPNARVTGAFVLRVAQAHTELQNYAEGLRLARQALGRSVQGELREQALWIKGCSEHRLKDLRAAAITFQQLVTEFPNSKLTEGARRLQAMTAEDRGDLETALKLYLDLNYGYDVAYFIDVLLPTDRLADFIAKNPQITDHNRLLYTLGVRYLRDKRWEDARSALRRVRTEPGPPPDSYNSYENDGRERFPKEPDYRSSKDSYIRSSWVARDQKTIDILQGLEQAIESAEGDEARAEAMYQLASYQFDENALLFYNPAAWDGERYWLLSSLSGSERFRLPNESQNLFEYSQSHETLARAIPIYMDIAARFPETKSAKDALYSAAVAHERLANLNPYWREIYESGLFAGSRNVQYADVKRQYPTYQLPRGTNGWEPSTRTVNDGPGWASKPEPLPKLTRGQKIEQLLKRLVEGSWTKADNSVQQFASGLPALLRAFLFAVVIAIFMWSAVWIHVWRKDRTILPPRAATLKFPIEPAALHLDDSTGHVEKIFKDKV